MVPLLVFTIILLLKISHGLPIRSVNEPALLIVSYDGFRPDYLNRNVTPHLNAFRKAGTSAKYMMNVFPTKTFVNHFTIATGLFAEKHGVLGNELYDLKLKKKLGYGYELFHQNNNTEPIWITNEKAGKHSGCMMWTASEFEYNGVKCTFTEALNMTVKPKERVDIAMSWFLHPKTPANLIMLYVEQPDEFSHVYGYESSNVTSMVAELDDLTNYIQKKLVENGLDKRVNVIHLSDHGMNSVTPSNIVNLTDLVPSDSYKMYGTTPVIQIVPNDPTKESQIFDDLLKESNKNGHFKVYKQKSLPRRWHVNNTDRMGPIIAVSDVGYGFQDEMELAQYYSKKYNLTITNSSKFGVHGYDNKDPSMHAFFMAKGPLIASGKELKSVNMIDLYNLFCRILDIKPSKNDGSTNKDAWNELLTNLPPHSHEKGEGILWAFWAVIFIISVVVVVSIMKIRQKRQQHVFTRNRERSKYLLTDFENVDDNEPSNPFT